MPMETINVHCLRTSDYQRELSFWTIKEWKLEFPVEDFSFLFLFFSERGWGGLVSIIWETFVNMNFWFMNWENIITQLGAFLALANIWRETLGKGYKRMSIKPIYNRMIKMFKCFMKNVRKMLQMNNTMSQKYWFGIA